MNPSTIKILEQMSCDTAIAKQLSIWRQEPRRKQMTAPRYSYRFQWIVISPELDKKQTLPMHAHTPGAANAKTLKAEYNTTRMYLEEASPTGKAGPNAGEPFN